MGEKIRQFGIGAKHPCCELNGPDMYKGGGAILSPRAERGQFDTVWKGSKVKMPRPTHAAAGERQITLSAPDSSQHCTVCLNSQ